MRFSFMYGRIKTLNLYATSFTFCIAPRPIQLHQFPRPRLNTIRHNHQTSATEIYGIKRFLCEMYKETKNNLVEQTILYNDFRKSLFTADQTHSLQIVTRVLEEIMKTKSDLDQLEQLIHESHHDEEMVKAAASDKVTSTEMLHFLEVKVKILRLDNIAVIVRPTWGTKWIYDVSSSQLLSLEVGDEVDDTDIILELSAGVGGQEAMLFTKDMFDMYLNYTDWKQWKSEILDYSYTDMGGLHSASLKVSGRGAGQHLKFESGVHRVQRVPKTERSGRIHTSTMAVAILPCSKEIEISINPKDLKIETKRSSGAGGQHVNTTDSCVRITHLPTGIVAECQVERSQIMNRQKAMQTLSARLYQRELQQRLKEEKDMRKLQVGTASRSEKVRTYNYVQNRITDHRLGKNYYEMEIFMAGGEKLNELIRELLLKANLEYLQEYFKKYE